MKKQNILTVLVVFVLLFCMTVTGSVYAEEPVGGEKLPAVLQNSEPAPKTDFEYIKVQTNKIQIKKYIGSSENVIIPEEIDGLPVIELSGGDVFSDNHKVKYVKIPSTVTTISSKAFNLCDELINIDVDENNTAFSSLNGVLYNKDLTKLVCFPCGKPDNSYTVPKSVKIISDYAFDHCFSLNEVLMYNNVTEIGDGAFSFCWNMSKIHLSDNLIKLGKEALAYCRELKEIHLPATLRNIGQDAVLGRISSNGFREYYFIDGIYAVPGTYSYSYLQSLKVPIENTVRSITDIDTGIVLVDNGNSLLSGADLKDLKISPVSVETVKPLINSNYTSLDAFDIALTCGGKEIYPTSPVTLLFDGVNKSALITASKIYFCKNSKAKQLEMSPTSKAIGVQVTELGRFIFISSNDFSIKGDADGDGIISAYDARIILCAAVNNIIELSPEQLSCCKVKSGKTGNVTIEDARAVLRCAADIEELN